MPAPAPAHQSGRTARHVVLVVEDDSSTMRTFVRALEAVDCDVVTAATLAEGLRAIARLAPSLIVLDLKLDDSKGLATFESIRQHARCPVIIVSGFLSTEITVAAMEQHALHVFEKPLRIDAFLRVVRRGLMMPTARLAAQHAVRTPAGRLVQFILAALDAGEDLTTNLRWADCAAVSVSTLSEACYLAKTGPPHNARDLMRVLSACLKASREDAPFESFLDVADRRTVAALTDRAGIAGLTATATAGDVLDRQQFLPADHQVIRLLREALRDDGRL